MLRPLSDLFLWLWRLERRLEFLYRPQFDRRLRGPLFDAVQRLQNSLRTDEHLALAEEKELPDEDRYTAEMIDEISKFTRENWLPGGAQRFGNTKTFGVLRAEFTVLDEPSRPACGTACSPRPAATRRTSGSPGRGRTRRPTSRTSASARSPSR